MNMLQSFLIGFLKPALLASINGFAITLQPALTAVLVAKGNVPPEKATLLSADLVSVVTAQLTVLINKL